VQNISNFLSKISCNQIATNYKQYYS